MAKPRTLYDKIWDDHMVDVQPDGTALLYIDRAHALVPLHLPERSDGEAPETYPSGM